MLSNFQMCSTKAQKIEAIVLGSINIPVIGNISKSRKQIQVQNLSPHLKCTQEMGMFEKPACSSV